MKGKIERTLATAQRNLDDGDMDGSINRSYYAMFYAAQLYFRERHPDTTSRIKTHNGTITKFGQLAVQVDRLDPALYAALSQALAARIVSDYDFDDDRLGPTREFAEEKLRTARWFCRTILEAM